MEEGEGSWNEDTWMSTSNFFAEFPEYQQNYQTNINEEGTQQLNNTNINLSGGPFQRKIDSLNDVGNDASYCVNTYNEDYQNPLVVPQNNNIQFNQNRIKKEIVPQPITNNNNNNTTYGYGLYNNDASNNNNNYYAPNGQLNNINLSNNNVNANNHNFNSNYNYGIPSNVGNQPCISKLEPPPQPNSQSIAMVMTQNVKQNVNQGHPIVVQQLQQPKLETLSPLQNTEGNQIQIQNQNQNQNQTQIQLLSILLLQRSRQKGPGWHEIENDEPVRITAGKGKLFKVRITSPLFFSKDTLSLKLHQGSSELRIQKVAEIKKVKSTTPNGTPEILYSLDTDIKIFKGSKNIQLIIEIADPRNLSHKISALSVPFFAHDDGKATASTPHSESSTSSNINNNNSSTFTSNSAPSNPKKRRFSTYKGKEPEDSEPTPQITVSIPPPPLKFHSSNSYHHPHHINSTNTNLSNNNTTNNNMNMNPNSTNFQNSFHQHNNHPQVHINTNNDISNINLNNNPHNFQANFHQNTVPATNNIIPNNDVNNNMNSNHNNVTNVMNNNVDFYNVNIEDYQEGSSSPLHSTSSPSSALTPPQQFSPRGVGGSSSSDQNEQIAIHDGDLYVNGVLRAHGFIQYSDILLKTDIEQIVDALSIIRQFGGKKYRWKEDNPLGIQNPPGGRKVIGLIAQEVQKVLPEAVELDKATGYLSVSYAMIVPVLLEALKQHLEEYEKQQTKVNSSVEGLRDNIEGIKVRLEEGGDLVEEDKLKELEKIANQMEVVVEKIGRRKEKRTRKEEDKERKRLDNLRRKQVKVKSGIQSAVDWREKVGVVLGIICFTCAMIVACIGLVLTVVVASEIKNWSKSGDSSVRSNDGGGGGVGSVGGGTTLFPRVDTSISPSNQPPDPSQSPTPTPTPTPTRHLSSHKLGVRRM